MCLLRVEFSSYKPIRKKITLKYKTTVTQASLNSSRIARALSTAGESMKSQQASQKHLSSFPPIIKLVPVLIFATDWQDLKYDIFVSGPDSVKS